MLCHCACGRRHLGLQMTVPGTGQSVPSLTDASAVLYGAKIKSQAMSIEFIYIMPLLVNNLVESRDSCNINETAGLHSVCHTVT